MLDAETQPIIVQCKICGDNPCNHGHGLDPMDDPMYVEHTPNLNSLSRPLIKRKETLTATVTSGIIISGYLQKPSA